MGYSPALGQLIHKLQLLPGVGPKSAQRMALSLLEKKPAEGLALAAAIQTALERIRRCQGCRTYTETELCQICQDRQRDASLLCVVESPLDLMILEQSSVYAGRYFVMHGRLSPLDGVGPEALGLDQYQALLTDPGLQEVILATNATIEGEATAYYLTDLAKAAGKQVSRLAQGVPMGSELEFIDGRTLSHALLSRQRI